MTKKIVSIILSLVFVICVFSACGNNAPAEKSDKLSIVATIFPQYDFARQIVGDKAEVSMLLPVGSESHSYEASSQDILKIQNCDIFIYVGGESDEWVRKLLSSIDTSNMTIISLMDVVDTKEEVTVEGMDAEDEHDDGGAEIEYDEHIWTSPVNAVKITNAICDAVCLKDSANAETYKTNAASYVEKLKVLDNDFRTMISQAKRKTFLVADRFPFRYFADEYGLKYYAAFAGCSASSDPSAETVKFLINKVNGENLLVIFYIEFSNRNVANTVLESTNAKALQLHSCHNVSKEDFDSGVSYVDLMRQNLMALKEALN